MKKKSAKRQALTAFAQVPIAVVKRITAVAVAKAPARRRKAVALRLGRVKTA